jgi:hypothetical protein
LPTSTRGELGTAATRRPPDWVYCCWHRNKKWSKWEVVAEVTDMTVYRFWIGEKSYIAKVVFPNPDRAFQVRAGT